MNVWRGIVRLQIVAFVLGAIIFSGLPAAEELADRPEPSTDPIPKTTETTQGEYPGVVDANDFEEGVSPNTPIPDDRRGVVDPDDFNTTETAENSEER